MNQQQLNNVKATMIMNFPHTQFAANIIANEYIEITVINDEISDELRGLFGRRVAFEITYTPEHIKMVETLLEAKKATTYAVQVGTTFGKITTQQKYTNLDFKKASRELYETKLKGVIYL